MARLSPGWKKQAQPTSKVKSLNSHWLKTSDDHRMINYTIVTKLNVLQKWRRLKIDDQSIAILDRRTLELLKFGFEKFIASDTQTTTKQLQLLIVFTDVTFSCFPGPFGD